jgi:hypothetical protein
MSIRSLTTLAVARDTANHGSAVSGGGAGADGGSKQQTFADALTSAIPTEPLAAYTALIAIIAAAKSVDHYLTLRWGAYVAFLAIVVASAQISFSAKKPTATPVDGTANGQRKIPLLEIMSAVTAAAAWGLAAPGSGLQVMLRGESATLTVACITIGGAALVSLMAPYLTRGSNTSPDGKNNNTGAPTTVA